MPTLEFGDGEVVGVLSWSGSAVYESPVRSFRCSEKGVEG